MMAKHVREGVDTRRRAEMHKVFKIGVVQDLHDWLWRFWRRDLDLRRAFDV